MARVTIYHAVLKAQTLQIARRELETVLREVEFRAKAITQVGPYTTGRLSLSIKQEPIVVRGDTLTGDVGTKLPYAASVHNGATPHLITPRGPYMLKFFWRKVGHVVRLPYVNHPGQKGKQFLVGPLLQVAARHGWPVYTREI
jgi:hypothetical protein